MGLPCDYIYIYVKEHLAFFFLYYRISGFCKLLYSLKIWEFSSLVTRNYSVQKKIALCSADHPTNQPVAFISDIIILQIMLRV